MSSIIPKLNQIAKSNLQQDSRINHNQDLILVELIYLNKYIINVYYYSLYTVYIVM